MLALASIGSRGMNDANKSRDSSGHASPWETDT